MIDDALTLLSMIGLASQFLASALLAILYALLGREVRRRFYFRLWGRGWTALAFALAVLVLRFELMPAFGLQPQNRVVSRALIGLYVLGKLAWCLFFVVGTLQYVQAVRRPRTLRTGAIVATLYAAIVAIFVTARRGDVMVWQSPVVAGALGYCAWLMLRVPLSRRTLGSRFTGGAFAANALLWLAYGLVFAIANARPGDVGGPLPLLVAGNSFIDQMVGIALGYGMVVLLLEDAKREVDAAHAELSGAHHELRRSALYDPVTGSLNRRAYEEGVGLEQARATFGAVAMMDLDNLKDVNDTQGHGAGDALLRRLADALRGGLRPSDKLYRWGGDEFLLIMPGAGVDDLLRRVESLLAAAGAPPILVSIGAAPFEGTEGLTEAIPVADSAMYEEKKRRKLAAGRAKASA